MQVLQEVGINNEEISKPKDILNILSKIKFNITKNNKKISYLEIPISWDIETTSFRRLIKDSEHSETEKIAIMYEWSMSIDFNVIIGRTWKEFIDTLNIISKYFNLDESKRIIIYVHNLSFDFQFLRKRLKWSKVFSLDTREPLYALTTNGIEFRCSYLLSGYSLANLAKQLKVYKFEKLKGDLDYKLLRHYKTKLSNAELKYCINDVQIVVAYIKELISRLGSITKIPLTKTGYVRNYCREKCFYEDKSHKKSNKIKRYRYLMKNLTLTPENYLQCKRAFMGGFTHASTLYVNDVVNDVGSFDFTSSYPYVMISEKISYV